MRHCRAPRGGAHSFLWQGTWIPAEEKIQINSQIVKEQSKATIKSQVRISREKNENKRQ